VTVRAVVDYDALEPGARTSQAIRATARSVNLAGRYGASVRITGEPPLADEEFASVREGAALNGIATFFTVLMILWLALHSVRLILAVLLTVRSPLLEQSSSKGHA
jgi:hypothetical protein